MADGSLIFTPHPVTLDGQRVIALDLIPGETLGRYLDRAIPEDFSSGWEVRINGVVVPHEVIGRVRPKPGTLIEVRSIVGENALYIIAMAALTYFTFGLGTAAAWGAGAAASAFGGGIAGALFASAVFAAGSIIINKVLGPKPPKASQQDQDSVYSIGAARNQPRPYQPLPLLFGRVRIAPDVLSAPYSWFEGNDMHLGMVLTPGLNVGRVEPLDNGDTPLSSYDGVAVTHAGFSGMPSQPIPLYSNANTIQGGELPRPSGGVQWVERTTPPDTVRVQINIEYLLGDQTSKGKPHINRETVNVQYRATGDTNWQTLASRTFANSDFNQHRATISVDLPRGQYDIRASIAGTSKHENGTNGRAQFQWTTMTAVQADDTDYTGIPRIGVQIKATGQLNGAPDELRCIAYSEPAPLWDGVSWQTVETSNPGAHMLRYARGIYDTTGKLQAGMGLPDAMIDVEAFKAFMVHCTENEYTYDYYIRDPRNHDEMLASLALVGMGQHSWASGKLSVAWAASGQPIKGVVNMGTIKRAQFQVDYTLANLADGIEYTYYDSERWDTGVVRVSMPGVETPLNPAAVTGEGVTRHEHAAELARWHLAQSLYQYKDISYSTDLEHLSYRRLDTLALQHDMTQWGFGGRVVSAQLVGGLVELELDAAVPPPPSGGAFIGLRIPGERSYRVMPVQSFAAETDRIRIAASWPPDAPIPGDDDDNPAHDTIWVYDFKATPGYRVRVVGITPESDLKGASVSVVPEGPEYWTYIKTGQYQRPSNQSLLSPRPEAKDLIVSESQVVQGDTIYTELQADWNISGTAEYCIVSSSQLLDGVWSDASIVAETRTNTARFRIPGAGVYRITVRPYTSDGLAGISTSATYATIGAELPPPAFDWVSVEQVAGGLREYSWGYTTTVQPANFAGAEVRYSSVLDAAWSDMLPIGNDGFHTSAFESTIPESGTWRIAFRARNTDGLLGETTFLTVTLAENLGQQIEGIEQDIDAQTQALIEEQQARDAAIAAALVAAAEDAQDKVDAAKSLIDVEVDGLQAQLNDFAGQADDWSDLVDYPAGDYVKSGGKLYRALQAVPAGTPLTDTAYWQQLGNYSSAGEAISAALVMSTQNASDISAESQRVDTLFTGLGDANAEINTLQQALSDTDQSLANFVTQTQASFGDVDAQIIAANQARADGDAANASAIMSVRAATINSQPNLIANPSGESGTAGWNGTSGVNVAFGYSGKHFVSDTGGATGAKYWYFQQSTGIRTDLKYTVSADLSLDAGCTGFIQLVFYGASGYIGETTASGSEIVGAGLEWVRSRKENITIPAGTTSVLVRVVCTGITSLAKWRRLKLEQSTVETAYNEQGLSNTSAQAILQLDAEVDDVTQTANAVVGLHTNVGGKIAGMRSKNNGIISAFEVMADVFRVIASGSVGMEILSRAGGYFMRFYAGAAQIILGINFGQSNNLCFWYGPNVGEPNAAKSNGTVWFDNTGSAYFGGELHIGVLKNAAKSTQVSTSASVETGSFTTNGTQKIVTSSLSYIVSGILPTNKNGHTASATIVVERSINGGAWTQVATYGASGTYIAEYDPGVGYITEMDLGGSVTHTDNNTSTHNHNYRARITSASGWPVTMQNGSGGTQTLSIMSVEDP